MIQVNRRNDLGSRMRRSLLVILLFEATFHPITAPECCPTKTLRNAPAEDSDLNGVYILKTKMDSKPDAVCVDTCVYVKDNKEYCFKEQEGATPTVVCEVAKKHYYPFVSSFAIICFPSLQFDIGISFFQFLGSNTALLYQFQLTSYVSYNQLRQVFL